REVGGVGHHHHHDAHGRRPAGGSSGHRDERAGFVGHGAASLVSAVRPRAAEGLSPKDPQERQEDHGAAKEVRRDHQAEQQQVVSSQALKDNPLGDPSERPLYVYLPPGYDNDPDARYPSVYVIQGLTGQVDMWKNRSAFRPNFLELTDRLFSQGDTPPAIVAFVDAWTSLGGSQYLDSPGTGNYHTYLCEEVVPFLDANYRTDARRERRGIEGKSSGGYGAFVTPMLRPDLFSGLASH